LHRFAQVVILHLQLLTEPLNLFKGARIGDGHRRLISEDTQPGKAPRIQRHTAKNGQHPQDVVAKQQRLSREAADALTPYPLRARNPGVLLGQIGEQDGYTGGANMADFAHGEWEAAKGATEAGPVFADGMDRLAGT